MVFTLNNGNKKKYEQSSDFDKLRINKLFLFIVSKKYPILNKHIVKIKNLIMKKEAPLSALNNLIFYYVGKKNIKIIMADAIKNFIKISIRQRTLHNKSNNETVCHGCFSYCSQFKCYKCKQIKYCAGCIDYGDCIDCKNY